MSARHRDNASESDDGQRPPTLWQSWMSVLAAFFGVQSSANRERDFTRGRASHFILLGLLATALLVLVLVGAVWLAMAMADA
ncbi:hypothetical protein SAOR_07650 [Salinisphaera orenii MK-B5]|uniref:DUF2970 domain-containing protein n=1 Tax=Salinisphaera orenii MK-B5 TaxID=856730 RepID=A0A423PQ67_9GAMM|nr:DUF2970 domain-containing protein [Salinisphaera orenii]ROO27702.1 hypothetical protein SAOR_07650 [Salinisphaera orenii MK-B5]